MNRISARSFACALAVILPGLLAATPASAQLSPAQGLIENPFVANLGVFIVGSDLKAKVNGTSTNNPEVDFNNEFGTGSDQTRVRLDLLWRIVPKHHVRFFFFDNDITRSRVVDRDIQWGDTTYHLGTNVESNVKMKVYELAYEYAFMHQPNFELDGTFGIHYTDLRIKLAGNATTGGGAAASFVTEERKLPAPLPVIGVRAGWAFAPQWYLEGIGQLFKIDIDGYNGNWFDARVGVTWMFHRNFGVGLGYNRWTTRVDVNRSNFNGDAKFGYSGLQAFLTGTF
jgi:hypothetical protein